VPIPALLIEDVNIEFQMEVSATEKTEEKTAAEVETEAKAGFSFWKVNTSVSVKGKVSSSRETTRQTNQTAKYQVRVVARQQQQTEGLSRLMDIMAECVTPVAVADKK
jgi:membrane-bound lytic murein transglycosylase B